MAETSFPIVEQPMSAEQWKSVTLGIGNGVFDEGGSPYSLTAIDNATNTVQLTAASLGGGVRRSHAILGGFYHKIDANLTLDVPAVTSSTTYYIALQLDHTRAAAGGLPVEAGVFTTLDTSQQKQYLVLHEIDREPNQLLSDAARRWVRPRVSPTITVSRGRELPPSSSVLRWTLGLVHGGGTGVPELRINSESGWRSLTQSDWIPLPEISSMKNMTAGHTVAIQREGTTRRLRGRFQRQSGADYLAANSDGYIIANLDAADAPTATSRHWVYGAGDALAYLVFYASERQIRVHVTKNCGWIDIGQIEWSVPEVN